MLPQRENAFPAYPIGGHEEISGVQDPLSLDPRGPHEKFDPSDFEMLPADLFEFEGKLVGERVPKPGLGAPLVVAGKDRDFTEVDEFAQGKQIFYGLTASILFEGRNCESVLTDPLTKGDVQLDGHS